MTTISHAFPKRCRLVREAQDCPVSTQSRLRLWSIKNLVTKGSPTLGLDQCPSGVAEKIIMAGRLLRAAAFAAYESEDHRYV